MSLIGLASRGAGVRRSARAALDRRWHDLLESPSWEATLRLAKERPVSLLILDPAVLPAGAEVTEMVGLRRAFPSLPVLVLVAPGQARLLYDLGRARVGHLELVEMTAPAVVWARAMARAMERAAPALVVRALSGCVPPRELAVVRGALEVVHRCWPAERLARSFGLSRPVLSERLKAVGLPSVGHLMVWARLLHAGHWLPDPGRSGESVSRQLEYANGAVFRRALRNYVDATPTAVAEGGGLPNVLEAFALRHAAPLVQPRVWVA